MVLLTKSAANVDLPEAGTPAIPIKRRLLDGILAKIVRMFYFKTDKGSLSDSVDGNEGELCDN